MNVKVSLDSRVSAIGLSASKVDAFTREKVKDRCPLNPGLAVVAGSSCALPDFLSTFFYSWTNQLITYSGKKKKVSVESLS